MHKKSIEENLRTDLLYLYVLIIVFQCKLTNFFQNCKKYSRFFHCEFITDIMHAVFEGILSLKFEQAINKFQLCEDKLGFLQCLCLSISQSMLEMQGNNGATQQDCP